MNKKIPYFIVDPGGNTTAIVPGVFNAVRRKKIALNILRINKEVEQVGFWMPARSKKTVAHLEMAGGEFCGNATRALASLINKKDPFFLETSGLSEPIKVEASRKRSSIFVPLNAFRMKEDLCSLPGITHLLNSTKVGVWVRDIGTLYDETACASGTAALAYRCWYLQGVRKLKIRQPSGAIFKTEVKGNILKIEAPIRGLKKRDLLLTA